MFTQCTPKDDCFGKNGADIMSKNKRRKRRDSNPRSLSAHTVFKTGSSTNRTISKPLFTVRCTPSRCSVREYFQRLLSGRGGIRTQSSSLRKRCIAQLCYRPIQRKRQDSNLQSLSGWLFSKQFADHSPLFHSVISCNTLVAKLGTVIAHAGNNLCTLRA